MSFGCRAGETERNWFRGDRIYNMSGQWFFTTREGDQLGPFSDRDVAEREAKLFASIIQQDGLVAAEHYVNSRSRMKLTIT